MIAGSQFRRSKWITRTVLTAVLMVVGEARGVGAQSRSFTACTPDALGVCTHVRLTAGVSSFEVALNVLGATGAPATPVSVYNLIFGTGANAAGVPGSFALVPGAVGGATVSDPSEWDLFDAGDVLFLSAITNRGVGGCEVGADIGGFGQAATTCGSGQFVTFAFVPTDVFDPSLFTVLNFEAVGLTEELSGASCGSEEFPCLIREGDPTAALTAVPEPVTLAMLGGGLLAVGIVARRRN